MSTFEPDSRVIEFRDRLNRKAARCLADTSIVTHADLRRALDLVEFLLARLDDEQRLAEAATAGPWSVGGSGMSASILASLTAAEATEWSVEQ